MVRLRTELDGPDRPGHGKGGLALGGTGECWGGTAGQNYYFFPNFCQNMLIPGPILAINGSHCSVNKLNSTLLMHIGYFMIEYNNSL